MVAIARILGGALNIDGQEISGSYALREQAPHNAFYNDEMGALRQLPFDHISNIVSFLSADDIKNLRTSFSFPAGVEVVAPTSLAALVSA